MPTDIARMALQCFRASEESCRRGHLQIPFRNTLRQRGRLAIRQFPREAQSTAVVAPAKRSSTHSTDTDGHIVCLQAYTEEQPVQKMTWMLRRAWQAA